MEIASPTPLLGGLSPAAFMRRHWQKKPLLVRAAAPGALPAMSAKRLFELAAQEGVESRLVRQRQGRWHLRHGPLARRSLPALAEPGWTLLVQGVDLHDDAVHALLGRFRFVPDVRLDDAMLSFASPGGGVGPHVDSYDVFLLQVEGRRRWRIARPRRFALREGVSLKMLADFEAEQEWLLDAGDMLYLPPGWGHDGVAEGACITCSIGFRSPREGDLGADLLQRLGEAAGEAGEPVQMASSRSRREGRYRDPGQAATSESARIPATLAGFAETAIDRLLTDRKARARVLGEILSEPKADTVFDRSQPLARSASSSSGARPVALDRRTRMLYDDDFLFVNGESFSVRGRDAVLLRRLADTRRLDVAGLGRLSRSASEHLSQWHEAGWLHDDASIRTEDPR